MILGAGSRPTPVNDAITLRDGRPCHLARQTGPLRHLGQPRQQFSYRGYPGRTDLLENSERGERFGCGFFFCPQLTDNNRGVEECSRLTFAIAEFAREQ